MLIRCVVYQKGERLADIEPNEIHTYLGRPDCFVWVALRDPERQRPECDCGERWRLDQQPDGVAEVL